MIREKYQWKTHKDERPNAEHGRMRSLHRKSEEVKGYYDPGPEEARNTARPHVLPAAVAIPAASSPAVFAERVADSLSGTARHGISGKNPGRNAAIFCKMRERFPGFLRPADTPRNLPVMRQG